MPRKPIDYSKAIIYKICCKNPDECAFVYVGSTTNFIMRKNNHKNSCINEKNKNYHLKVYQIIRENGGWTNWNMLMLEEYPCENSLQLRKREEEVRLSFTQTSNSQRCFTDGKCSVEGCENLLQKNGVCVKHGAKHKRCTVDGCENQKQNNGLCVRHGAETPTCTVDGCENQKQNNGLCVRHGAETPTCTVDGCENKRKNNGLCVRHGAKRLPCTVDGCEYQRIKNGLCCKHGGKKLPCTVQDCTSYRRKNGLCYKHRIKN